MKKLHKHSSKILYLALASTIVYNILFPALITEAQDANTPEALAMTFYSLPEVGQRAPRETKTISTSAYSSTVDQCDADPFTTASGTQVHVGTVANNCLAFGTKVRFPELYGDQIFVIEDRMNSRYGCNTFDIWMTDRGSAIQFGRQTTTIEIL